MSLFDRIKNMLKKTKEAFVNFFTGKSRKESKKKKTGIPPKSSPTADPKSAVHKMNAKATHRQEKKARRDAKKKAKADAAKAAKEASREARKAEKEKRKRAKESSRADSVEKRREKENRKRAKEAKQNKRQVKKTNKPSNNNKVISYEDMTGTRNAKELIERLQEIYNRDRETLDAIDAYKSELGLNTQGMLNEFDADVLEILSKIQSGALKTWDEVGDEYYSIMNEIKGFYLNGESISSLINDLSKRHNI